MYACIVIYIHMSYLYHSINLEIIHKPFSNIRNNTINFVYCRAVKYQADSSSTNVISCRGTILHKTRTISWQSANPCKILQSLGMLTVWVMKSTRKVLYLGWSCVKRLSCAFARLPQKLSIQIKSAKVEQRNMLVTKAKPVLLSSLALSCICTTQKNQSEKH